MTNRIGTFVFSRIAARSCSAASGFPNVSTTATASVPTTNPAFPPACIPGIAIAAQTPCPASRRTKNGFGGSAALTAVAIDSARIGIIDLRIIGVLPRNGASLELFPGASPELLHEGRCGRGIARPTRRSQPRAFTGMLRCGRMDVPPASPGAPPSLTPFSSEPEIERWDREWLRYLLREHSEQLRPYTAYPNRPELP